MAAKACVGLALDHLEATPRIDAARGQQVGVGPEHHLPVASGPRERNAFVRQPRSQAMAPGLWREDEQAQLSHRPALAHHEHRARTLAIDSMFQPYSRA